MQVLHFSISPVQEFIAEARRLRDFWAGSFLLSWLAGQAMLKVVQARGEIVFPAIERDALFEAIKASNQGKAVNGHPYIGSLPNRFKARVPKDLDPKQVRQAVLDAWQKLADTVWETFVQPVASAGNDTKAIWDRQVKTFWDITWVIGEEPEDGSDSRWLDERKNWRNHWQPDEPNPLCSLMGRYQEISGHTGFGRQGREARQQFWSALAAQEGVGGLDLAPGERLCAIALIKRFFPLVAKDVLGWQPGADELSVRNWPSTSYIAAVPWLKAVAKKTDKDMRQTLPECFRDEQLKRYRGETETQLYGLPRETFFKLDGHLLHKDGIPLWCLENVDEEERRRRLQENAIKRLTAVEKQAGTAASEFYAILIMDGDRIGAKIGNPNTADIVKEGLAIFTSKARETFAPKANGGNLFMGALIYAGGDDVLAFLPVDTAIEAAYALRAAYSDAFRKAGVKEAALNDYTMSAAIVFTHFKNPMRLAIRKAHHFLDDVAKEQNGRDSIALAVMKPGGVVAQWVSCWQGEDEQGAEIKPACELLTVAKEALGRDRPEKGQRYSSSLLYNIRTRYQRLWGDDKSNTPQALVVPDLIENLLLAEYRKQGSAPGKSRKVDRKKTIEDIQPLLCIGRPFKREDKKCSQLAGYDFNGAMIARFLALEGRWWLQEQAA